MSVEDKDPENEDVSREEGSPTPNNKDHEDESTEDNRLQEIDKILEKAHIPDELKVNILKQVATSYRGPVPPPEIIKGYNELIPNGGDRLLSMTERQSAHRQRMENKELNLKYWLGIGGQVAAFIIVIFIVSVSAYIYITTKKALFPCTLCGGTLGAVASAFLYARKSKKTDEE